MKTINNIEDIVNQLGEDIEVESLIPEKEPLLLENHSKPQNKNQVIENDENTDLEIIQKDEAFVRGNMLLIIETAMEKIKTLSEIAENSGHPRAFEVLTSLIGQTMDANKDLLEIHAEKRKSQAIKDAGKVVNNNAIFVGSTNELLEMIKNNTNNDKE